jgi:hypothetical protein
VRPEVAEGPRATARGPHATWLSWRRAAGSIALAGIAVAAIAAAVQLAGICVTEGGLPLWDGSAHGLAGVELARALRRGDLLAFLLGINQQVLWPFVHPLMLAPWLLLRGDGFTSTDQFSSLLFAGTVLAVFAAGWSLHPTRGAWVATAAAALALLAPEYRLFGTLTMLEMPGAFLLAVTLALWLRSLEEPGSRPLLAAAGLSTTALFLCKYNYGLLWLVPLAWHELSAASHAAREPLARRALATLRGRRWARPFPLFMLIYALALAAIQITGGGVFELLGTRVSVRSPGNAAYVYYLLLLGWAGLRIRRTGGVRKAWRSLPSRARILVGTVLLPLAVWFLIPVPNRVKNFFGFVSNRDSEEPLWTLPGLLFYPKAFVQSYSPTPLVGWLVLALAVVPPLGRRRADRLLYAAFAFGLLATMAHRYHDPRFLFTVALLVWLRAAQTAVAVADHLLTRLRPRAWIEEAAWTTGLIALLAWSWSAAPSRAAVAAAHREWYTPAGFAAVLDRVLERASQSQDGSVLLGYSNWLSPGLLRWEAFLTRPDLPAALFPKRPLWPAGGASDAEIATRIEALRTSGRVVIAALPTGLPTDWAPGYRAEVWADSVMAAKLARDPGVVRLAIDSIGSTPVPFAVSVFRFRRRADPDPAAPAR